MEVKCPKCRYRYETTVSPGISEVACVCPRCGTPFVHAVGETVASPSQEPPQQPLGRPDSPTPNLSPERGKAEGSALQPAASHTPPSLSAGATRASAGLEASISGKRPAGRQVHGCLRNCLVVFLLAFIAAVFAVRNCFGDRSYKQAMLENGINESLNEFGDGAVVNDYEPFVVEGAETAPEWLQGTWRAETEAGPVVIIIRGNKIAEESGQETSHGTFYYKKKALYCKFRGSSEVETRRVNTRRQCIVYDRQDMEKQ